jgi:hypothetical protein
MHRAGFKLTPARDDPPHKIHLASLTFLTSHVLRLKVVTKLEPLAVQGWLERAKLEEEAGHMAASHEVLGQGIKLCWSNELLMRQYLRAQEWVGNLSQARAVLSRLQAMPYILMTQSLPISSEMAILKRYV